MYTIQYKFHLSVGKDGFDTDAKNPLSRALSALLASGKNHKAQSFCYLHIVNEFNISNPQHWLGVFIHSSGNRILFFPGLNIPVEWVDTQREGAVPKRHLLNIDHFSAEPVRQRWHITSPNSDKHINGGRLPQIPGKDSFHWIGLSFQNYNGFWPLYKETYVIHQSPQSDVGRRMKLLNELENTTSYVQVNIENKENFEITPSFLHICLIISRPTATKYDGAEFLMPIGSPFLGSPIPDPIPNFRVWYNRIPLSTSWDIQVITMLLPGSISRPLIFTSPASL